MIIKCWCCGKPATKSRKSEYLNPDNYKEGDTPQEASRFTRSYCDECFAKRSKQAREEAEMYRRIRRNRMFERAVSFLEGKDNFMDKYHEAIDAVHEYMEENPTKFESSDEVLAAIVLINNRIRIKPQYEIGGYKVDFLLPEDHIVLEIDGDRHKLRRDKDYLRDETIKQMLVGWEVVRIPSTMLEQNPQKLIGAIEKLLDYRSNKDYLWKNKR